MAINTKALGRRIRERRLALDLTQALLGERAELDTTYVSQVERGAKLPSLVALDRVATVLKTSPSELLAKDKAAKDDPLLREVRDILAGWDTKKRKAVLKALRALAGW